MITDRITAENRKPGSIDWLPRNLEYQPGSERGHFIGPDKVTWLDSGRGTAIEGWCSHTSVRAGDTLSLYVSTAPACEFSVDVFRMGYYGGLGARHMFSIGSVRGTPQPEPVEHPGRMMECLWDSALDIVIPDDWLSGVYLGKLTRLDNGIESYVIFVVRDSRPAALIAQTSDFTWQAYNRWPEKNSLYSDGVDLNTYYGSDVAVSFNRPYLSTTYFNSPLPGTGEFFVFEYPFVYWLERQGYDVTYCANLDTHSGTAEFARAQGFLSIGHDEYVTLDMYRNLSAARDDGLSLGFFCGNSYCFQVGLRPDTAGRPDRVFSRQDLFRRDRSPESGYEPHPDEVAFAEEFGIPLQAPDDGLLMGARNAWPGEGVGDWVCSLPEHWVFEGTGMRAGDVIPNLVGHEWHGAPADIPGLDIVSEGRTWLPEVGDGAYAAVVYPGPSGNIVFNASSCWWGTGLAHPPGFQRPTWNGMPSALPDRRAQRITQNVLDRMLGADAPRRTDV